MAPLRSSIARPLGSIKNLVPAKVTTKQERRASKVLRNKEKEDFLNSGLVPISEAKKKRRPSKVEKTTKKEKSSPAATPSKRMSKTPGALGTVL